MAGFTDAYELTVLDLALANGDKIAWSENGSSESANLAKTTITTWKAASAGAKVNNGAYESAAASGAATITHFAIFASDGTTQKTDWTALQSQRVLGIGDKISIADGAISVTLD